MEADEQVKNRGIIEAVEALDQALIRTIDALASLEYSYFELTGKRPRGLVFFYNLKEKEIRGGG